MAFISRRTNGCVCQYDDYDIESFEHTYPDLDVPLPFVGDDVMYSRLRV